jgi:hypothetical protein
VAGRISEWQRRLDTEGSVTFRQNPWPFLLLLALCVVFTVGMIDALVVAGASFWAVLGLILFGALGIPLSSWLLGRRSGLRVTQEGIAAGRGVVVPFDHVVAVTTRGRNLTIDYRHLPGQRLVLRQRKTGLKQHVVALSPFGGGRPSDVAYWLLQLSAGPDARIDVRGAGGRLGQVYQVAEKPFWER